MKKNALDLGILFLISAVLFFFVYRGRTPYPYLVNWDLLHQTTLIKQLIQGNFSLILTQISDTFTLNTYTPLFHLFVAMIAIITKSKIIGIFWWLEFIHYCFTTIVAYWIGKKLINNRLGGFITGLISLLTFESTAAYTTLFFLPLTISGTLAALFLVDFITCKKNSFVKVLFSIILVTALHYLIGALYVSLLLIILLEKRYRVRHNNNLLIRASIMMLFFAFLWNLFGQKIMLLGRPDAQYFIYSLEALWALAWQWYGILPFILLPIGILKLNKDKTFGPITISIFSLTTALILLPLSYSLKFYVVNHYFVSLFTAAGIVEIIALYKNNWLKLILIVLISAALVSVFITNVNKHLELSFNGKESSYISDSDFKATAWIDTHYQGRKVFLVSDPTTQGTFEALSTVNSQGGAFPRLDTVKLIDSINKSNDPKNIADALLNIHDTLIGQDKRDVTILVMGGRYFAWMDFDWNCKISYACQSWLPLPIKTSDKEYLKSISDSTYMKLVYSDDENSIFELSK